MTARSASGKNRHADQPRPPGDEAARGIDPRTEIEGLSLSEPTRSGEDARRRGWFWHWNSIVTQYAPLLTLKGVGLLNSYTVWTDRRDESPHRGYAFPSQQSEADFYGEDRAELIAINKVLVALDLIEIRKVMALRPDEQGRKYRAQHNLYRVKDRDDDYTLTARDVLKVAELADANPAIFRLTRRVYSKRFAPIDQNGPWPGILAEVRQNDVWRRLAEKVEAEETRASARTKAGHQSRKTSADASTDRDAATMATGGGDSSTGDSKRRRSKAKTSVDPSNTGFDVGVAPTNSGLSDSKSSDVEQTNTARPTGVAPTNRTYDQSTLTTTTTISDAFGSQANDVSRSAVTAPESPVTTAAIRPAPSDGPGRARAVAAFQDANDRAASRAEQTLLEGLADRFDAAALRQSPIESGWSWVAAAVYEAVESGSSFVAPRRLREILTRWEREGAPAALTGTGGVRPALIETPSAAVDPAPLAMLEPVDNAPFIVEECGMPSGTVWAAVLDEIVANQRVSRADRDAWLRTTRLAGRGPNGELIVIVPSALAQRRIQTRLKTPLAAAVAAVIGAPTEIEIRLATAASGPPEPRRGLGAQTG